MIAIRTLKRLCRQASVVLALAAAAIGLVAYSFKRRWLMAELVSIRATRDAV